MKPVDLLRLLVGALALLAPGASARRAFGAEAGTPARAVFQVLGARQCLQSVVTANTGRRALSAGVDVLHAASMLPVLAAAPRRAGRFALTQIVTAGVLATLELAADHRSAHPAARRAGRSARRR